MYNRFILIGKVEEIRPSTYTLILAVPKPFKNIDGNYTNDYIKVTYSEYLKELVENHIYENLKIGVKGYVEGDGQNLILVAKKIKCL